jgi:hypothetical protein
MDASLSLLISIIVILLLIRFINISVSILVGAILLGLLTIGTETFNQIFISVTSLQTLKLLAIVVLAFTLGYSMEYFKLLNDLTNSIVEMTGMLSLLLIPLIIGLLPMPGGALISAVMLVSLVKKFKVSPERATYINFWFRHPWVTVWPLYPSFVVGMAVVNAPFFELFRATYPIAIISIASGVLITRISGGIDVKFNFSWKNFWKMIYSFYPVILVALGSLILRLDLLITLLISILILFIHKKVRTGDLKSIFKKTIDFKIIVLIFAVMIYKNLIEHTGSAEIFFRHLNEWNFSPTIASFLLSFLIGFSTGVEISYASIALPLLTTFTGVGNIVYKNFMLVFGAGYLGVMLSPLHLCLVFSSEYYKADLIKVYKTLLPTGILTALLLSIAFILM